MPRINRESEEDARLAMERMLPEADKRQKFIAILCEAINVAHAINPDNWNLNLDLNGKFLRFNTGHEYCIQLASKELFLVCDRTTLPRIPDLKNISVEFFGYNKKRVVFNNRLEKVPDVLASVKNSVGCFFDPREDFSLHIDKFKSSNRDFIGTAMKTPLMPIMRRAHSQGAVDYIFSVFRNEELASLPKWNSFLETQVSQLNSAARSTHRQRLTELKKADPKPKQITVQQTVFIRNQFVVAEVLFRAKGHCEICGKAAPFFRSSDGSPYLEVHHKIRLADGGNDTLENALALCPDCHRQAHYGTKMSS